MAITYGNQPPDDEPPQRSAPRARQAAAGGTGSGPAIYEKEARSPRGMKAVYIHTLTHARFTQAAAELGVTVNEMAEEAMREHLRRTAAALFQREFQAAQEEAAASRSVTPQRWEYERVWRAPAWSRE